VIIDRYASDRRIVSQIGIAGLGWKKQKLKVKNKNCSPPRRIDFCILIFTFFVVAG
jgi:hypothetical protein